MSKIDISMLDKNLGGWESKTDQYGNQAFKGPFLPDWFDDRLECHKANQEFLRISKLQKLGLNEHGQTKEQQKAFEKRKEIQLIRKEHAESALLASKTFEGGR